MDRHEEIRNAYKDLGNEATFYDGMITCSTLPGKAEVKSVEGMAAFRCRKGKRGSHEE